MVGVHGQQAVGVGEVEGGRPHDLPSLLGRERRSGARVLFYDCPLVGVQTRLVVAVAQVFGQHERQPFGTVGHAYGVGPVGGSDGVRDQRQPQSGIVRGRAHIVRCAVGARAHQKRQQQEQRDDGEQQRDERPSARLSIAGFGAAVGPCRLDQRLHHIAPHFANTTTFGMTLSANTSYVIA